MPRTVETKEGTVGHLLRRLRERAGISQSEVAARAGLAGVNQTAVSRWERNEKPLPTWEQLRAVIVALEGSPGDFAEGLSALTGVPLAARRGASLAVAGA